MHQVHYEQLSFGETRKAAFFTFVFPVVLILIFGAVFSGAKPNSYYNGMTPLQYYIPTIAAVSVLGACHSQLAIVLANRRQMGILKRLRATPLPASTYFGGLLFRGSIDQIGRTDHYCWPDLWLSCCPTSGGAVVITLVVAAASFCALGVAVASVVSNADAAPAVVQLLLFPLVFISGNLFSHPFHRPQQHLIGPAVKDP